jgi:hypothetical protein
MDEEKLRQLLNQDESTTLEFKQELHQIDHSDKKVAGLHRDELIKDILSLANGNVTTVGDHAYLIIGAGDTFRPDGTRELFNVDPQKITQQRLLQIVNKACMPRLQDIEVDTVELENKQLLVITIWPTPHLHETIRELNTPQSHYSEHVVFIRHNENIAIASAKEREAILKLKQIYFAETRKVSPVKFGALVGAVAGGLTAAAPQDKENPPPQKAIIGRAIGGPVIGAFLGSIMGWNFVNISGLKHEWHFSSPRRRFLGGILLIAAFVALWQMYKTVWLTLKNAITLRLSQYKKMEEN